MCVHGEELTGFPAEYISMFYLNRLLFSYSIIGLIGLGIPLVSLAVSTGTILGWIASVTAIIGSSVILCCTRFNPYRSARGPLNWAMALNSVAIVLQIIALCLIIWAWDAIAKALRGARCGSDVSASDCNQARTFLSNAIGSLLWVSWVYILLCVPLEAFVLFKQRKAYVALLRAPPPSARVELPAYTVDAFPVVTSTVVDGTPYPPPYAQAQPAHPPAQPTAPPTATATPVPRVATFV